MVHRIALIHAVRVAIPPVEEAFARHWPDAERMNLLDDSLSRDRSRDGRLTPAMFQRFATLTDYAFSTGADGILFTCSAFGPAIGAAGAGKMASCDCVAATAATTSSSPSPASAAGSALRAAPGAWRRPPPPELAAPFLGTWYVLGMLIPTAVGAAIGPLVLRW